MSPATASVLTELERFDWLSRGQGPIRSATFASPQPCWMRGPSSRFHPAADLRRYYVPATKADTLPMRIGEAFDAHDVSMRSAMGPPRAPCAVPFQCLPSTLRVLIGTPTPGRDRRPGRGSSLKGANLAIIEAKSPGLLFREKVSGLWLASPIQIHLDLLLEAIKMAEHFRKGSASTKPATLLDS